MHAMILNGVVDLGTNDRPLESMVVEVPIPGPDDVLLEVLVCGVCHTELDEIEGRTPPPRFPIIPGHQVIGRVLEIGSAVQKRKVGDRVGVAWIYSACGTCRYCLSGQENLCSLFQATGRDHNGGYAEYMVAPAAFVHPIPDAIPDAQAAPLLCAGAVGYRAVRLTGLENGQRLGLTGFGASGHLVLKMVRHRYPDLEVYVFARSEKERAFALDLGAVWAGDTADRSPEKLDAIIDTTPVWKPVVEALANLAPGGRLVINAIRKQRNDRDVLQNLDYATHLWNEKEIKSVANVTRRDVAEFLDLAAEMRIRPETEEFALEDANRALMEMRAGDIRGAKVLRIA